MSATLTLEEAKAHLNITTDEFDFELDAVLDAAEAAVASRVGGPITADERTARIAGCSYTLILPSAPVASITALADTDGTTVDVDDLTLNSDVGTVEYTDGTWFGATRYDVTYQAGWSTPPDDVVFAIKELVRHLWKTQRGASARPGSPESTPAAGYLIPYAVAELLEPYRAQRVS